MEPCRKHTHAHKHTRTRGALKMNQPCSQTSGAWRVKSSATFKVALWWIFTSTELICLWSTWGYFSGKLGEIMREGETPRFVRRNCKQVCDWGRAALRTLYWRIEKRISQHRPSSQEGFKLSLITFYASNDGPFLHEQQTYSPAAFYYRGHYGVCFKTHIRKPSSSLLRCVALCVSVFSGEHIMPQHLQWERNLADAEA